MIEGLGLNLVEPSARIAARGGLDGGIAVGHHDRASTDPAPRGRRCFGLFDHANAAPLAVAWDRRSARGPGVGAVRKAQGLERPGRATTGPAGDRPRPVWERLSGGWPPWRRGPGGWEARPITGWGSARRLQRPPRRRAAGLRPGAAKGMHLTPSGAYHEAKANLTQGKLHAAERRLEQALARGGPGLDQVRDLLGHIYQIEVRFDDAKVLAPCQSRGREGPDPRLERTEQPRAGSAAVLRPARSAGEGRPTGAGGRPCLARQGPTGDRSRPLGGGARMATALRAWNVLMRRCGGPGSSWHAAPADPTRRSMRRGSSAPGNSTSESGSRCGRGCTNSSGDTRAETVDPRAMAPV